MRQPSFININSLFLPNVGVADDDDLTNVEENPGVVPIGKC